MPGEEDNEDLKELYIYKDQEIAISTLDVARL